MIDVLQIRVLQTALRADIARFPATITDSRPRQGASTKPIYKLFDTTTKLIQLIYVC